MRDTNKTPWNPSVFETECCWDTIYSAYPGQFSRCKCGETFIDETRYYGRHSGKLIYIGKLNGGDKNEDPTTV